MLTGTGASQEVPLVETALGAVDHPARTTATAHGACCTTA